MAPGGCCAVLRVRAAESGGGGMNALETFILAKWLGEKVTEWEKAAKPDLGVGGGRKAAVVEGHGHRARDDGEGCAQGEGCQ